MNNAHIRTYYRLLQNRLSDCTLEPTERMSSASYYGWAERFNATKTRVKYIRAVLSLDNAIEKMVGMD